MLSTAASNTLLKTLEEPPGHVVFVLATTNPEKVLPTIRSRTQHFELTLSRSTRSPGCSRRCSSEKASSSSPRRSSPIARAAGGSARDAESLLDQVLAHATGPLTVGRGRVRARRLAVRRPHGHPRRDRGGGRRRRAHRARRAARVGPRRPPHRRGPAPRRCATRSCSSPARGQVHVDAPEDEQERLRSVGEVLGNAALVRGARDARPGASSTCAAPTPRTRASCSRSRSCGSPGATPAGRCRSSPTGSSGSSSGSQRLRRRGRSRRRARAGARQRRRRRRRHPGKKPALGAFKPAAEARSRPSRRSAAGAAAEPKLATAPSATPAAGRARPLPARTQPSRRSTSTT